MFKNKEEVPFPTTTVYPLETVKKVQSELLKMVNCISNILENHQLPYMIAFGTLIGAIKFRGFLPWDDDIDLFLFDESYNEAIYYLERELPKEMIVHGEQNDPNYFLGWNSIKNLNVEVRDSGIYNPHNRLLNYRCLGVDLYRLKKVAGRNLLNHKKDEARKFFDRKLRANIITPAAYEQGLENYKRELDQSDFTMIQPNQEYYSFVVKMKQPIVPNSIFPLKRYGFENIDLWGPRDPIDVLNCSFDSIQDLPPYEERKPHLSAVNFLNLNTVS